MGALMVAPAGMLGFVIVNALREPLQALAVGVVVALGLAYGAVMKYRLGKM